MRILVSGASGFIGQHLCPLLADNNLIWAESRTVCDFLNVDKVWKTLKEFKPTHLVHLAWQTGKDYANSRNNFLWLNSGRKLVEMFYENGGRRFLGIGSCYETLAVHGSNLTLYGDCKRALAAYLENEALVRDLSWAWGRPYFILGPGEPSYRLVPSIIRAAIQKEDFYLASPERVLDYMDVRDVAAAIKALLLSNYCGYVDICTSEGISLKDLTNKFMSYFVNRCELKLGSLKIEPMCCVGDNTVLVQHVGFYRKYNIDQSISKCIQTQMELYDGCSRKI